MFFENRRRDSAAEQEGTKVSEEERAKLAEEAGMVRCSFPLLHLLVLPCNLK